jgi:hypothetical protein
MCTNYNHSPKRGLGPAAADTLRHVYYLVQLFSMPSPHFRAQQVFELRRLTAVRRAAVRRAVFRRAIFLRRSAFDHPGSHQDNRRSDPSGRPTDKTDN